MATFTEISDDNNILMNNVYEAFEDVANAAYNHILYWFSANGLSINSRKHILCNSKQKEIDNEFYGIRVMTEFVKFKILNIMYG